MQIFDHKTKVLAIAPYSGLREMFRQIGASNSQISLTVLDGDGEAGLLAAKEAVQNNDYDLIISRGGTADMIRENIPLPILEVEISARDILHAIKLTEAYRGKSALVGFPATTKHAKEMCQLLGNNIPIHTIHAASDADTILHRLNKEGYSLVIGDTVVSVKAVDAGLTPVLITSSRESIEKVFDQVSIFAGLLSRQKMEKKILTDLLSYETSDLAAFDQGGNILFSSDLDQNAASFLKEIITAKTTDAHRHPSCDFSRQYSDVYLTASVHASEDRRVFYVKIHHAAFPSSSHKNFVKVFSGNAELAENFLFQPKTAETYFAQYPLNNLCVSSSQPVLLLGENGTFFDSIVSYLYDQENSCRNSFTLVELKNYKSSHIEWLLNNPYSPLFNTHSSIYFRGLDALPADLCRDLISFLEQSGVCRRNKVFFSVRTTPGRSDASGCASEVCRSLMSALSPFVIPVSPFRECPDIMPDLAIICINALNTRYNKQIIGIAPDGIQLLQEYSWPDNFDQFFRAMKALVQTSNEITITSASVKQVLQTENSIYLSSSENRPAIPFNLNRTMDEITLDIIKQVVSNEKGNQKKAAEILGISRTTLWRRLKENK